MIKREDVLRVARECGIEEEDSFESGSKYAVGDKELERFAAAVGALYAEDMRERAAEQCDYDEAELAGERIRALPITPEEN